MKLVPKLTAVLVVGMCVVLGINGYFRVKRETAALEQARSSRHHRAAAAIGAAMAHAWKTPGGDSESAAVSTMAAISSGYTNIDARWVKESDNSNSSGNSIGNASAAASPLTGITTTIERDGKENEPAWYTRVPVTVDGVRRGYVVLHENAHADEENAREIVFETIKTATALVLLSAILAFLTGHWIVGKPVRTLATKARRIGQGDFDDPPLDAGSSSDELAELAREMNAMCERLTTTLEQLRHADRLATVGKLASGVAHELGTPLNVVSARAEMLIASESSSDESREFAQAIQAAAQRMTVIIAQLLQFARRTTVDRARRDVGILVRDAVELLRPLARKRQVSLDVKVDAPGGGSNGDGYVGEGEEDEEDEEDSSSSPAAEANVDPGQLQQVVTNLVMNAVHASSLGGKVTVRVDLVEREPSHSDAIRIAVEDNGSGISPNDLPRIFEPFFTTKDVGDGTGLGLAVTDGIVREHQGWIEVKSKVGVGSTFEVFIPRESGRAGR